MNIGFVTCVQLGLSCMEAIYQAGGQLKVAITLPDHKAIDKSGRVYIDNFCSQHEIDLLKADHINDSNVLEFIKRAELDWLFVIGWSQIAGPEVLGAPANGVLGIHPTLLPQGRGRASIPWAILKSLKKTGVTLFKLDSGVDTGPILDQYEIPLSSNITATELYHLVNLAHVELIKQVMPRIVSGRVVLKTQDNSCSSIWPGRKPGDGLIDFSKSVLDADKLVRATTHPYPGAFFYENDRKVIVWRAEVRDVLPRTKYLEFRDGLLVLLDWEYE